MPEPNDSDDLSDGAVQYEQRTVLDTPSTTDDDERREIEEEVVDEVGAEGEVAEEGGADAFDAGEVGKLVRGEELAPWMMAREVPRARLPRRREVTTQMKVRWSRQLLVVAAVLGQEVEAAQLLLVQRAALREVVWLSGRRRPSSASSR